MNKKSLIYVWAALLIVIGLTAIPISTSHADNEIRITYNGSPISFNVMPVVKNNIIYAEARPFIQPMGYQIQWINAMKFRLSKASKTIDMELNSASTYVNDSKLTLEAKPILIGTKLFLPVRQLAKFSSLTIVWTASTNTLSLLSTANNGTASNP
jgi:hypothetical protein